MHRPSREKHISGGYTLVCLVSSSRHKANEKLAAIRQEKGGYYCTTNELVQDYCAALRLGAKDKFRNFYLSQPVLYLDGMEDFTKKPETRRMLCRVLWRRMTFGKPTVVALNSIPKDLQSIEKRKGVFVAEILQENHA